jgi:hypothetical protein
MQFRLPALPILLAILLAGHPLGCGRSFDPPPKPLSQRQPLYSLEVRHESGITNQAWLKEERDDVTLGGFRVQVVNVAYAVDELLINGKNYGRLGEGDRVLIERDGQVLINGTVREPG